MLYFGNGKLAASQLQGSELVGIRYHELRNPEFILNKNFRGLFPEFPDLKDILFSRVIFFIDYF